MYQFDPVFVKLLYHKADAFVCGDLISCLGKTVKMFDDKTAERIVIIR